MAGVLEESTYELLIWLVEEDGVVGLGGSAGKLRQGGNCCPLVVLTGMVIVQHPLCLGW